MSKQQSGGLVERNITLRTAVLMMYCLVAAGAFGIEGMISDAGPGMTIVILCVLPFIWAAPQALCSAELGSFITEDSTSGYREGLENSGALQEAGAEQYRVI